MRQTELVKYNAAIKALAVVRTTDEVQHIRNSAEAMRAYARQAKDKQLEIDAIEIRLRSERRLGEMIIEQKETVGLANGGQPYQSTGSQAEPVKRTPTLAEAGIDKKLSSRSQKLAAIPVNDFDDKIVHWREQSLKDKVTLGGFDGHNTRGTQGTGENEWYTPEYYLRYVRQVLGEIDLDPASSEQAQKTVCAKHYFTEKDDGLSLDWYGNVWLNPPYAQPLISHFADKLIDELGNIQSAIVLTHNYTDTKWFQKLANASQAICFTGSRICFVSPSGDRASPTQGQAFFYFGGKPDGFSRAFSEVGFIVKVQT